LLTSAAARKLLASGFSSFGAFATGPATTTQAFANSASSGDVSINNGGAQALCESSLQTGPIVSALQMH
jgi:hypothetical protein